MAKVKLTQIKSKINRPQGQKDTLLALGLRRLNHSVTIEVNPQIQGMINKVSHLLKVEQA
jgi:large subunit ribosomal protein L30